MSAKIKAALSLCVFALSTSVGAEPIRYDLILTNAYGSGPSGTASFYWDRSSELVSSFRWDFGWGYDADGNHVPFTGGIDDSSGYWTPDNSGYLFEILTGYNVHPADCEQPGDCGIHFVDGQNGYFGTLPWGVEFGNEREGAGFWAGFSNDVFSTGPVTTSGACEPGMATARLRGEVTFSLPGYDVAWGRAPAGSPVITQVTYDRCSLGSYRGYGAIVGDFEGSLLITFPESSFTEQDDVFYWEPDPGGFGARSPWATFSGPDLVALYFDYIGQDPLQYLDIEGLAFEGWVDDELVLAGTLRAVPLPGTLPLLCLGLFGLAMTRRKAHRAIHAGSRRGFVSTECGETTMRSIGVLAAALMLGISPDSGAGALTLTGSVTSCDPAYAPDCTFEVGTPTRTRVIFDHNLVDRVGRHTYPIGQLHGTLTMQIGWMEQTERDDFFWWNEIWPESPRHGWYNPDLIFEDGRLVGFNFLSGFDGDEALRISRSFEFFAGYGSRGTLATTPPRFMPEPGTLALLGIGLAGLGLTRRRRCSCRTLRGPRRHRALPR